MLATSDTAVIVLLLLLLLQRHQQDDRQTAWSGSLIGTTSTGARR